jgi:CRP/FNR family transcriptional regulator
MLNKKEKEFLSDSLSFWQSLTSEERSLIQEFSVLRSFKKGSLVSESVAGCSGLFIVKTGQLRAFINSADGREISLYRLLPLDVCIMTASCMIKNLSFDVSLCSEKDSELIIIPTNQFEKISKNNPIVKDFMLQIVSSRFSDVMWVLEQLVFTNVGRRLAAALLEHSSLSGSTILNITHIDIANEIGTAREVVTRLLKQFQLDGMVKLSRSRIEITDIAKLGKYSTDK